MGYFNISTDLNPLNVRFSSPSCMFLQLNFRLYICIVDESGHCLETEKTEKCFFFLLLGLYCMNNLTFFFFETVALMKQKYQARRLCVCIKGLYMLESCFMWHSFTYYDSFFNRQDSHIYHC